MARFRKLLGNESATTSAEYAVILTLIVAALVLASDAVRLATNSTFHRSAAALKIGSEDSAAGSSRNHANERPDSPAAAARPIVASMPPTHALAWGALLMAMAVVVHARLRHRRAKRSVSEIHSAAEPAAEEPSNPNFGKRQEIQRILLRHFDDALHSRIEVRHVMSRTARTVFPTALVSDLREIMEREGFHHLLVLKEDKLIGVISDRDIHGRRGRQAQHIMTANPVAVSPGTQVAQAISIMLHRRISCLPIVEQGRVVGILTVTDVLMTLQCLMKLLERAASSEERVECSGPRTIAEMPTVFMNH